MANAKQQEIIAQITGAGNTIPPQNVESQKARTFAQGVSFGFSDEIEAAVRSIVPGSKSYDSIRDELRTQLSAYKEANPGEALTFELAGALVPSIAMMMVPGGQVAGMGNLGRAVTTSALESGLSAIGQSEAKTGKEFVGDVTKGTAAGTVIGTGVELTLGKFGQLGRKLIDFTRAKFGGADTAVQKELLRLSESTGKTVDEIIADVAEGRIIADNMTLGNAIKAMVNEGGVTRSEILSASGDRAARTREQAMGELRETMTPQQGDPNVIRARRQTQEQLKAEESAAYGQAFKSGQNVSAQVADEMLNILQTVPTSRQALKEIYEARNIVPLFRQMDDGSIQFMRSPTLEDAEILRRNIKEQTGTRYRAGEGTMGEVLGAKEKTLRSAIDVESPDLAAVRASFAQRASAQELFEIGQKRGLTMNVDELQVLVESLSPEKLDALRAGMMDAINNRARRSGTTIRDLANEDRQLGAALRVVLPKGPSQSVLQSVGRAAEAGEMNRFIQPQAGSPTQALMKESELRGAGVSAEDILRGSQFDPMALIRIIKTAIPSAQGMSDQQMTQVARVLFSEDPKLVEAALKDKTKLSALLKKAETVAQALSGGVRIGAEQQAVEYAQE
jgi:hypothetical protein